MTPVIHCTECHKAIAIDVYTVTKLMCFQESVGDPPEFRLKEYKAPLCGGCVLTLHMKRSSKVLKDERGRENQMFYRSIKSVTPTGGGLETWDPKKGGSPSSTGYGTGGVGARNLAGSRRSSPLAIGPRRKKAIPPSSESLPSSLQSSSLLSPASSLE